MTSNHETHESESTFKFTYEGKLLEAPLQLTKEDFDHIHRIFLWTTDHVEEYEEDDLFTHDKHNLVWNKVLENANENIEF